MTRKIASIVFLLTGIVIGLGAFGHGSHAAQLVDVLAKSPAIDAGLAAVLIAVWYFASGCMLVFAATVVWTWMRVCHGDHSMFFATDAIGVFYIVTGIASVVYTGKPFFWVFVVLGGLLLLSSMPLRRVL
jgi:hypothetical protein